MVVNCLAGPGNVGWVLWKSSQLSQLLRHLSNPPLVAFSSHTVFTILAAVRLVNMKPTYTFKYKAYWYPQIWYSLMLPKYEVCQYTQIIWSPLIFPNMKPFHDSQIKSANFFIVLSEMKVLTSERKDVGLLISCICHAFVSKLFPLSLPSSLLS